jgi:hypothetical protein
MDGGQSTHYTGRDIVVKYNDYEKRIPEGEGVNVTYSDGTVEEIRWFRVKGQTEATIHRHLMGFRFMLEANTMPIYATILSTSHPGYVDIVSPSTAERVEVEVRHPWMDEYFIDGSYTVTADVEITADGGLSTTLTLTLHVVN